MEHRRISGYASDLTANKTSTSIIEQRSGGDLPEMYLALADPYGQIVGISNSEKL